MSSAKYSLLGLLFLAASCNGQSSQAMRQSSPKPVYPPPQVVPSQAEGECVQPKLPEGQTLKVSLNVRGGQMIQLSDNSNWMIAPEDINYSSSWLTPADVKISASGDPDFPCLITNMQTNTSVRAKRVTSLT